MAALPALPVEWLFIGLCKASLLLAAAWAGAWLLRHQSAALRHALWTSAVAVLLLLPLLPSPLPTWQLELPQRSQLYAQPAEPSPRVPARPRPATPPPTAQPSSAERLPAQPAAPSAQAMPAPATNPLSWGQWAFLLWAVGAGVLGFRFFRDVLRIALITRWSTLFEAADVTWAKQRLGVRPSVRVRTSDAVDGPLSWGVVRPVVLLPTSARTWTAVQLRVALLHELAHVRRWDYAGHVLGQAAQVLYWFNPLVWVAVERLHCEQEQACDDHVLVSGTRADIYADQLLAFARAARRRLLAPATVGFARRSSLRTRVRSILDATADRRPLSTRRAGRPLLVLAPAVLAALAVSPTQPMVSPLQTLEDVEHALPRQRQEAVWRLLEAHGPEVERALLAALDDPDAQVQESARLVLAQRGAIRAPQHPLPHPPSRVHREAWTSVTGRTARLSIRREDSYLLWAHTDAPGSVDSLRIGTAYVRPEPLPDSTGWVRLRPSTGAPSLRLPRREIRVQLPDSTAYTIDQLFATTDPQRHPIDQSRSLPHFGWLEAEDGRISAPMRADRRGDASGGRFVHVPDGDGNDPPDGGPGRVLLHFEVAEPGLYRFWGRVRAPSRNDNSFFVSLDGEPDFLWDAPGPTADETARTWTWSPMRPRVDGAAGPTWFAHLEPGPHTLLVRNREDGAALDGILFTNALDFAPEGRTPALPPARPVFAYLEAEEGDLSSPFTVKQHQAAVGGAYVEVADGKNSRKRPPDHGQIRFTATVTVPGSYRLWGRLQAPSGSDDSFWVRVNDGPWREWHGMPHTSEWVWSAVRGRDEALPDTYLLPAGTHTIRIAYREDGTRLDRLLITNDPDFRPEGPGPDARAVEVVFR